MPATKAARDERQPLLTRADPPSIPRGPFATLLMLRMTDGISFAIIFPYITPMLLHLAVPSRNVGLYAGLAEGSMMVTEALLAPIWAKIGPRIGKYRCLQFGTMCSVTATTLMGFSWAPWQIVACRLCMGINPMAIMSRSLLGEITTSDTRIRAFSVFTPSYVAGIMIGNILGGLLADPAKSMPVFEHNAFFLHWPFVLPSLVCGVISVSALLFSSFFIGKMRKPHVPINTVEEGETVAAPHRQTPIWADIKRCGAIPSFAAMLLMVCFFEGTKHGWNATYPIYAYMGVDAGGLGLSTAAIGSLFAMSTLVYIIASLTFFSRIHSKFGAALLIPICLLCFPLLVLSMPLGEWIARTHRSELWMLLGCQTILRNIGAFTNQMVDANILGMVDEVPEMTAMAYALKLIAAAVGKAVGPASAASLFSLSRQYPRDTFGHALGWLGLFALSLPMCFIARVKMRHRIVRLD